MLSVIDCSDFPPVSLSSRSSKAGQIVGSVLLVVPNKEMSKSEKWPRLSRIFAPVPVGRFA